MKHFINSTLRITYGIKTVLALAALLSIGSLTGAEAYAGIRGRVVNAMNGDAIANVRIKIDGTELYALTNEEGRFAFSNVPDSEVTLVTRYLGFENRSIPVQSSSETSDLITIAIEPKVTDLEGFVVKKQVSGQAQALNLQRTAENIKNVVSSEDLARARDGSIGEALQVLPGFYAEISTHQPSRIVVRGLASEFNSVTVDGIRMTNSGGDRRTGVGTASVENLSRVEMVKAVTPDMEGDAIGGSVNLVNRRAFELQSRLLELNIGGAFNHQQQNFDQNFGITYGDQFFEGRLGMMHTFNFYGSDRGYHDTTLSYSVDSDDQYRMTVYRLKDRIEDGTKKLSYNGSLDFQLTPDTVVTLRGSYFYNYRKLKDYDIYYRTGTLSNITPEGAEGVDGRLDYYRHYRFPVSDTKIGSIKIEHEFENAQFDATASYSKSANRYPRTFYVYSRVNGVDMTYDRSEPWFPQIDITNGVDLEDPANHSHDRVQRTQQPSEDVEYTVSANYRYNFQNERLDPYFKTGFRFKTRDHDRSGDYLGRWNYTGDKPAGDFSIIYDNPRYLSQSPGSDLQPNLHMDVEAFRREFYELNPEDFLRDDNWSDILIANSNNSYQEDVLAGYVMGGATFNRMRLMGGVRVEETDFEGTANELELVDGELVAVTPRTYTSSYRNALPGVHLTYELKDDLLLRASANRTMARPNNRSQLPVRSIDDENQKISDGNPDLRVTESDNIDLGLEYYLEPLGQISLGLFHKNIDGFYFNSTQPIEGGEYDGYMLTRPGMGDGGKLRGLEFQYQQQLSFLPGHLSGLGFLTNLSLIDASGSYPNRPGEDLPFIGTAKELFNAQLTYGIGDLDVRLAVNRIGDRLSSVGSRAALDGYEQARTTVDLLASYRMNERFTYYLDWKNITDEPMVQYLGSRDNPTRVRFFDWAINAGVKIKF